MRKKLLSLLTVLCLVLGMLPATALAAEVADIAAELGYSEEEIAAARYIDEDTELDEDEDGLIIVVAPVKVTVKGATLATGILVAPGAKGAVITVIESANVNAIIVMDTVEVVVEETATVTYLTVAAPEANVTIAGEAQTVDVAEDAESAVVTVAETAKVTGSVTNAAPNSTVSIQGEVAGDVTTTETAVGATTEVAEGAVVGGDLTTAAPDSTTKVDGTVEGNISYTETATGATLEVGENAEVNGEVTDATGELTVTGDGADKITVTDTSASDEEEDKDVEEEVKNDEEEEEEENSSFDLPTVLPEPEDTHKDDPGFIKAPLVDHSDKPIPEEDIAAGYEINVSKGENDNEFNVVIKAENVYWHKNSPSAGYAASWVGIAIPHVEGYKYYQLTITEEHPAGSELGNVKNPVIWDNNGDSYASLYFGFGNGGSKDTHGEYYYQISVINPVDGVADSDLTPEYVLNIAFEIVGTDPAEYWKDKGSDDNSELDEAGAVELTETEDETDEVETEESVEESTEEPAEDPVEEPAEDPVEDSVEEPAADAE